MMDNKIKYKKSPQMRQGNPTLNSINFNQQNGQMSSSGHNSYLQRDHNAACCGHKNSQSNDHIRSPTNHSYQSLYPGSVEEKEQQHESVSFPINPQHVPASRLMMTDEIQVHISESDDNASIIQRNRSNYKNIISPITNKESHYSSQIDNIYSDGEGADSCIKVADDGTSEEDQRPPRLPPRPPPTTRNTPPSSNSPHNANGIKKYVIWCLICGGFSCLLGFLFLGVYFLLHSYTITVGNFETVPTFVPAALLILTGLCVISLARRRNRYSYLIKLSGACGLISSLTCALVTVTTTVHIRRLQALRECEYIQKTRTCTCYVERIDKEGVRLVFDSLSDCGVVHGSLYSCLRAIFGLSVAGVLVAVFSCMLVYQLLSHERKKMYWEQLELRCRSLYSTQQGGGRGGGGGGLHLNGGNLPSHVQVLNDTPCRCCDQCFAHRQRTIPTASSYPFWRGQPPGNFYSPNPVGDDVHSNGGGPADQRYNCGHSANPEMSRVRTGWPRWPRLPWQRSSSSPDSNTRFRHPTTSPDSQYGFSNNIHENAIVNDHGTATQTQHNAQGLPYGVWGPPPPYSDPNSPARQRFYHYIQSSNQNQMNSEGPMQEHTTMHVISCNNRRNFDDDSSADVFICSKQQLNRNANKRPGCPSTISSKKATAIGCYDNTPSDSDGCVRGDRFSNSLPTRKVKKRMENKSIGPKSHAAHRINVQSVFPSSSSSSAAVTKAGTGGDGDGETSISATVSTPSSYFECHKDKFTNNGRISNSSTNETNGLNEQQKNTIGVENSGFQKGSSEVDAPNPDGIELCDPAESEVYFADVSSCCNISVKNDNYYEGETQKPQPICCMECKLHGKQQNTEHYLPHHGAVDQRLPLFDHQNNNLNVTKYRKSIKKEVSRQSMCSIDSTEETKTDYTDLSPATPNTHCPTVPQVGINYGNVPLTEESEQNFVPSPQLSSEFQSLEAHRRSTKNISDLLTSSAEVQYEVINEEHDLNLDSHFDNNNQLKNCLWK